MSNLTTASGEVCISLGNITEASGSNFNPQQQQYFAPQTQPTKKKRNQPGNPDPDAEVIALSPRTLLAKNRFVCEVCNKGFQRDQNLQLHRRGHNLPWKLKQRANKDVIRKKVYVCPEPSCAHHDPSRALGDLTGIKKHFCRKHGEKKWKCERCSKRYAVQSDWKAHSKTCGTKEYRCDCGTLFSRRDSFTSHRAFCDALAEESARTITTPPNPLLISSQRQIHANSSSSSHNINVHVPEFDNNNSLNTYSLKKEQLHQPQNDPHINYSSRVNGHHHHLQIIPPWLSPPQAQPQPQPLDHSSPPSVFSHQRDLTQQNPDPAGQISGLARTELFPPASTFHQATPQMSATALLQKAAQMGSTTTHQPEHVAAEEGCGQSVTTTMAARMRSATAGFGFTGNFGGKMSAADNNPSPFQDYMMNYVSGFDQGGSFDESFGGFLRTGTVTTNGPKNEGSGGGASRLAEGLTRDFLGLRPLSRSDILSFAGLENCVSSTSHTIDSEQQQHSQSQKQWQG